MAHKYKYFYNKMEEITLSYNDLHICGYPVLTPSCDVICEPSHFESADLKQQKCRCWKTISLLDESWYKAETCWYHPLKLSENGNYECCNKPMGTVGCMACPTHVCSYINNLENVWFKAHKKYCDYTYQSNIYALDCEFIYTTRGMEVARVSLIALTRDVKYDKYVLPRGEVLDYNTRFSGVTAEHLSQPNVIKSLSKVRVDLLKHLRSDSIIVGHGLHSDLKALGFVHGKIVDTSILYPHHKGFPYRHSLKYLAKTYLNIDIHDGESGHDSIKDSVVSLLLALSKKKILTRDLYDFLMKLFHEQDEVGHLQYTHVWNDIFQPLCRMANYPTDLELTNGPCTIQCEATNQPIFGNYDLKLAPFKQLIGSSCIATPNHIFIY